MGNKLLVEALECCVYALQHPKSDQQFALDAAEHALQRGAKQMTDTSKQKSTPGPWEAAE